MKLSQGATTAAAAVRDVACGMRSFSPSSLPGHNHFFLPLPRFRRKLVCFRALYVTTYQLYLSPRFDGITLPCPSLHLRCVRRASSKSPTITRATARRWRTCEYPIFTAFHFPLLLLSLFDFPARESAIRSPFDFSLSPMFVFPWIIQLLVSFSLSSLSIFNSTFNLSHKVKNYEISLLALNDDGSYF